MPGDNEIKFFGIAVIITNDRTVCINQDPVGWDILESILGDLYQIRADKSIRIIKEDEVFQEDVLIVMNIVKRLNLKVKEIINMEKGQTAIPDSLMSDTFQ
jgi:hypothetical protein